MVDLPEPDRPVSQMTAPRWPRSWARSRAATWLGWRVMLLEAGSARRASYPEQWSVQGRLFTAPDAADSALSMADEMQ